MEPVPCEGRTRRRLGLRDLVLVVREDEVLRPSVDVEGLPEMVDGQVIYNETPEFMAEKAVDLAEIGVQVIGGCCGTTPEHTRALRKALRG